MRLHLPLPLRSALLAVLAAFAFTSSPARAYQVTVSSFDELEAKSCRYDSDGYLDETFYYFGASGATGWGSIAPVEGDILSINITGGMDFARYSISGTHLNAQGALTFTECNLSQMGYIKAPSLDFKQHTIIDSNIVFDQVSTIRFTDHTLLNVDSSLFKVTEASLFEISGTEYLKSTSQVAAFEGKVYTFDFKKKGSVMMSGNILGLTFVYGTYCTFENLSLLQIQHNTFADAFVLHGCRDGSPEGMLIQNVDAVSITGNELGGSGLLESTSFYEGSEFLAQYIDKLNKSGVFEWAMLYFVHGNNPPKDNCSVKP